jgi:hypothetical protein
MKVFLLEVFGASYPLRITQLGSCQPLANGTRLRVSEGLMNALTNGPFAAHLRMIESGVSNTDLANGAWELVNSPAAQPAATDLENVAQNMSMAGKPGRRQKTKHLG